MSPEDDWDKSTAERRNSRDKGWEVRASLIISINSPEPHMAGAERTEGESVDRVVVKDASFYSVCTRWEATRALRTETRPSLVYKITIIIILRIAALYES